MRGRSCFEFCPRCCAAPPSWSLCWPCKLRLWKYGSPVRRQGSVPRYLQCYFGCVRSSFLYFRYERTLFEHRHRLLCVSCCYASRCERACRRSCCAVLRCWCAYTVHLYVNILRMGGRHVVACWTVQGARRCSRWLCSRRALRCGCAHHWWSC